jgi:hypothetical protein
VALVPLVATEQNAASPAPVSSTQPRLASSRIRANASISSRTVCGRNALRTSGRSIVTFAIPVPGARSGCRRTRRPTSGDRRAHAARPPAGSRGRGDGSGAGALVGRVAGRRRGRGGRRGCPGRRPRHEGGRACPEAPATTSVGVAMSASRSASGSIAPGRRLAGWRRGRRHGSRAGSGAGGRRAATAAAGRRDRLGLPRVDERPDPVALEPGRERLVGGPPGFTLGVGPSPGDGLSSTDGRRRRGGRRPGAARSGHPAVPEARSPAARRGGRGSWPGRPAERSTPSRAGSDGVAERPCPAGPRRRPGTSARTTPRGRPTRFPSREPVQEQQRGSPPARADLPAQAVDVHPAHP